jgi:ubiquinone/menaquinone biosynthesis C-methylase UbiE
MNLLNDFALRHPRQGAQFKDEWRPAFGRLLASDHDPIPDTALREGYYAGYDHDYWVSGALDALKTISALTDGGMTPAAGTRILEFGCSSGRVLRHLARLLPPDGAAWGTDVNRAALDWMRTHITVPMTLFVGGHTAQLPIEDEFFDAIAAFSVLTHLDRDEQRWLLELRRILKPGGVLYLTTLGNNVWREIGPGHVLMSNLGSHPAFAAQAFDRDMPEPRMAFGFDEANPYSYTVFRSREYIKEQWAPHFDSFTFLDQYADFQDVCVFRR